MKPLVWWGNRVVPAVSGSRSRSLLFLFSCLLFVFIGRRQTPPNRRRRPSPGHFEPGLPRPAVESWPPIATGYHVLRNCKACSLHIFRKVSSGQSCKKRHPRESPLASEGRSHLCHRIFPDRFGFAGTCHSSTMARRKFCSHYFQCASVQLVVLEVQHIRERAIGHPVAVVQNPGSWLMAFPPACGIHWPAASVSSGCGSVRCVRLVFPSCLVPAPGASTSGST